MQPDERERLRAAGFSDAEIEAELGPKRPSVRVASESTSMQGPGKAPARASQDAAYVRDLARNTAQGATLGFADEIEAGVRAPFSDRSYRDIRNQVRGETEGFARANPKTALAANIAGGAATGFGTAALAKGTGAAANLARTVAPQIEGTATFGQRVGAAAKSGAIAGGIGGAGTAEESDVRGLVNTMKGIGAGGVAGGVASTLTDAIKRARQVVASGAFTPSPVRKVMQGKYSTPETAGGRRVLQALGRGGMSVDDLEAASTSAHPSTAVAELIPEEKGVRALRTSRNVGRDRDLIDASLAERAAEEPTNLYKSFSRETGVASPRDPDVFKGEQIANARRIAQPMYEATDGRAVPDGAVASIINEVKTLSDDGLDLWRKARLADSTFPKVATDELTVGQLQRLRQVLDNHIEFGDDARNLNSIERAAQSRLKALRNQVDEVAKAAGGDDFRNADAAYSEAHGRAESFKAGSEVRRAGTEEEIGRLASEARDPEAFRQGSASQSMALLRDIADGTGGQTRNPAAPLIRSPTARAKTRTGFTDDASYARFEKDGEDVVKRLRTQRGVSGNSTTAANLMEIGDEFGLPVELSGDVVMDPKGALGRIMQRYGKQLMLNDNAAQATEMGRLLSAGLPKQMSREAAIRRLQELLPAMANIYQRNAVIQGQMAGGSAGRAVRPRD